MSFVIESTAEVVYSCIISDEDEEIIGTFIRNHPDEFVDCDSGEILIHAIDLIGYGKYSDMECINIYRDSSESDFNTQICRFDDDERTEQEIIGDMR